MGKLFAKSSLRIDAGSAVSGMVDHVEILSIVSGKVWITVEGSFDDYWLTAGDTLSVAPGRLIVIEAEKQDSCVNFLPTRKKPPMFDFLAFSRRFMGELRRNNKHAH